MSSGKRTGRKIVASLLGGANAAFLVVLGGSIPADDIIFGNLGPILMLAGLGMGGLVGSAWFTPRGGGAALLALGGWLMLYGYSFAPQAGLLLGGAGFVAGLLFVVTTGRACRSLRRAT
jgi:hypothetical protein